MGARLLGLLCLVIALGGCVSPDSIQHDLLDPSAANARPVYPEAARLRRQEGQVRLLVRVDAEGGVRSVRVGRSSGFELLDTAAREAVEAWDFRPSPNGSGGVVAVNVAFRLVEAPGVAAR